MTVLHIKDLKVVNNHNQDRVIPRYYSIDGMTFEVEIGERILIVGGPGMGKDTLSTAILYKYPGISAEDGYDVVELPEKSDNCILLKNQVYIKNGFRTRDYPQENDSGEITDTDAEEHWKLLQKVKDANVTFLAFVEIDKLHHKVGNKIDAFTRIIVINEGRIVADNKEPSFKQDLKNWIEEDVTKGWDGWKQDYQILRERFLST